MNHHHWRARPIANLNASITNHNQLMRCCRARIEMRHAELRDPDDDFDLDAEVQKLIDYGNSKNARDAARLVSEPSCEG
jgi:hypothetical protein